jgi:cellulose synthase/poly-beta-1,6-N-acetylglucosamine synthase-like glycosyltransferase
MGIEVSVLMPIRNGARFLRQALASLSNQTFEDWELVAILDASTDESEEILAGWGDSRLRVLKLEESTGIAAALNFGLKVARGTLIARLDSDDECLPTRFMTQTREMDRRPKVGLLGSYAIIIDEQGNTLGLRSVAHGRNVKTWMVIRNQFVHSSVMIRRSILVALGGYHEAAPREDYELWLRISMIAGIDNIPKPLVKYRIHSTQNSRASKSAKDLATAHQFIREQRAKLCASIGIPRPVCAAYGFVWEAWQQRYVRRP